MEARFDINKRKRQRSEDQMDRSDDKEVPFGAGARVQWRGTSLSADKKSLGMNTNGKGLICGLKQTSEEENNNKVINEVMMCFKNDQQYPQNRSLNPQNDYFTKFPEQLLFGYVLGHFDRDGLKTTMKLRALCKATKKIIDNMLNAVVDGDKEICSPQNRIKRLRTPPSLIGSDHSTSDQLKGVDENTPLRKYLGIINHASPLYNCLPDPSPINVLRNEQFMTNATEPRGNAPYSSVSPLGSSRFYPGFVPSLHASLGIKLAKLLNTENSSNYQQKDAKKIPRKVWKWWINALNHVEVLIVESDLYYCDCVSCKIVMKQTNQSSDDQCIHLEIAKEHAYQRLVLIFQILIRNRNTIKTAKINGPDKKVAFNRESDEKIPDLRAHIPGLSSLDSRMDEEKKPVSGDVSTSLKELFDGVGMRWTFPQLEHLSFSSTVDVRHAIPFIDGCEFPVLKTVEFAWLKAKYSLFKPQFGKLPIAVFAPINLFLEKREDGAPHLPAIYNGSLDGSFKLDGLGLYSCPIYTYEGNFEAGLNSRYGKMRANTGETYEGLWHRGLRYGHGRVTQDAGCVMEGNWHEDLLHGIGYIIKPEGLYYVGQWFHSAWDGWGLFAYRGKLIAYGQFNHGLLHGWSRICMANGGWEDVWWIRGVRVCDQSPESDISMETMKLKRRRVITTYFEGKIVVYTTTAKSLVSSRGFPEMEHGYYIYKPQSVVGECIPTSPIKERKQEARTALSMIRVTVPSVTKSPITASGEKNDGDNGIEEVGLNSEGDDVNSRATAEHFNIMSSASTPTASPVIGVYSQTLSPNRTNPTHETLMRSPVHSPVSGSSVEHHIYQRMGARYRFPVLSRQNAVEFNLNNDGQPSSNTSISTEYALRLIARVNSPTSSGHRLEEPDELLMLPQRSWAESSVASSPPSSPSISMDDATLRMRHELDTRDEGVIEIDVVPEESDASEWVPSSSSPVSGESSSSSIDEQPMAFSYLTDVAEKFDWSSIKMVNIKESDCETKLSEFINEGTPCLIRTPEGAAHVRYPVERDPKPNLKEAPSWLSSTRDGEPGTLFKGVLHSLDELKIARPHGDGKMPNWLEDHIRIHYGIIDPMEPLASSDMFNISHEPFFDPSLLRDLQADSWRQHLERVNVKKEGKLN